MFFFVSFLQNGLIDDVPQVPDDIFSHPHVLAVLQHGYTHEQIQSAFDHYGRSSRTDTVNI